jgi:hypothetical protein
MSSGERYSDQRPIPKFGLSAALAAMLAGALAVGVSGCAALPFLTVIPTVVSFAYNVATGKKSDSDTDTAANDQDATPVTEADADASTNSPPSKLTPENECHLVALARPDLVVVELRKNASGTPEYRELNLQSTSADDARWNPVVSKDTGPDGWRPAVNFLQMGFNPPLTTVIPDSGTCYLAYAPIAAPNGLSQVADFKSESGDASGAFSWGGRAYQYKVARTLPCLSPSPSS